MRDFIIASWAFVVAVLFACLAWRVATQGRRERAAFLEGRFGLDHETAYTLAEEQK